MATVLIVDDARFMRIMLTDILVEAGHRVVGEADSAEAAVRLYAELRPDFVTMDVVMPERSGLEGARDILRLDPRARVIMVSSVSQPEVTQEAAELGIKMFIVKPFHPDHVKERVAQALAT